MTCHLCSKSSKQIIIKNEFVKHTLFLLGIFNICPDCISKIEQRLPHDLFSILPSLIQNKDQKLLPSDLQFLRNKFNISETMVETEPERYLDSLENYSQSLEVILLFVIYNLKKDLKVVVEDVSTEAL
jgi:hypothetical protein